MTDKQEIIFQVLDWNCYEESDEEDVEFFKIRLYGRNQENKTVFVKVSIILRHQFHFDFF